jgi:transglutaminase-like putative cysteine protease
MPDWVRGLAALPTPEHDDTVDAVELDAETELAVDTSGRITRLERRGYRILRPEGLSRGTFQAVVDAETRLRKFHAWYLPPNGKEFELDDKDAVDVAVNVPNGQLLSDVRVRVLQAKGVTPGSIVAYESQQDERPYVLTKEWLFEDTIPVRAASLTLRLPAGWGYQATWLHHAEVAASTLSPGQTRWLIENLPAIPLERQMPPISGIAGSLVLALVPPKGAQPGFQSWSDFGTWHLKLLADRRQPSAALKQQVAALTAGLDTPLAKIRALAGFVQSEIRYVGIELGIGGWQPHKAADVFAQRFGDCKDKATLLSTMLAEAGVPSYLVLVNTRRGAVDPATPPHLAFNHAILAIALPEGARDPALAALYEHPALGSLLIFDPTDDLTPLGQLSGPLQANYAVLVAPGGGELVRLPQLAASGNSLARRAHVVLDDQGALSGSVDEEWRGDRANAQRYQLRSAKVDTDQIKPVEALLAGSLTNFDVLQASVGNLHALDRPLEWHYKFAVTAYAKLAGDLLLVRPRLIGSDASSLLETKKPRHLPIEFDIPRHDTDEFEIELPAGFEVDELPPPVHLATPFGSYDSETKLVGRALVYSRRLSFDTLSVPADQAPALREFFRAIARDERNTAVLKRAAHSAV